MSKAGRKRNRNISLAPPPKPVGDFGPNTAAQRAGAVPEPVEGQEANNVQRLRRMAIYQTMRDKLSQAQFQAAEEIYLAYQATMKSGAGGLTDKVDRWPNPSAAAEATLEITERYLRSTKAIPAHARYVIEHVCHKDLAISQLAGGGKDHAAHVTRFKMGLDSVAFKLGYS